MSDTQDGTFVRCVSCKRPVHTETAYGGGGSYWTHDDGYEECPPRYASPDFSELWSVNSKAASYE